MLLFLSISCVQKSYDPQYISQSIYNLLRYSNLMYFFGHTSIMIIISKFDSCFIAFVVFLSFFHFQEQATKNSLHYCPTARPWLRRPTGESPWLKQWRFFLLFGEDTIKAPLTADSLKHEGVLRTWRPFRFVGGRQCLSRELLTPGGLHEGLFTF